MRMLSLYPNIDTEDGDALAIPCILPYSLNIRGNTDLIKTGNLKFLRQ